MSVPSAKPKHNWWEWAIDIAWGIGAIATILFVLVIECVMFGQLPGWWFILISVGAVVFVVTFGIFVITRTNERSLSRRLILFSAALLLGAVVYGTVDLTLVDHILWPYFAGFSEDGNTPAFQIKLDYLPNVVLPGDSRGIDTEQVVHLQTVDKVQPNKVYTATLAAEPSNRLIFVDAQGYVQIPELHIAPNAPTSATYFIEALGVESGAISPLSQFEKFTHEQVITLTVITFPELEVIASNALPLITIESALNACLRRATGILFGDIAIPVSFLTLVAGFGWQYYQQERNRLLESIETQIPISPMESMRMLRDAVRNRGLHIGENVTSRILDRIAQSKWKEDLFARLEAHFLEIRQEEIGELLLSAGMISERTLHEKEIRKNVWSRLRDQYDLLNSKTHRIMNLRKCTKSFVKLGKILM